MDSALPLQTSDRLSNFTASELLDDLFQLRVTLAHDFIQLHRLHASFLQLGKRSAGLDGFMLARISDQENAVVRMQAAHKVMHLFGRCQRALVQNVEPLLAGVGLLSLGKMGLQG